VRIQRGQRRTVTNHVEEAYPTEKVLVDPLDTVTQRLSPGPRGKLPDFLVDTAFAPFRQVHLDGSVQRLTPQAEANKVPLLRS